MAKLESQGMEVTARLANSEAFDKALLELADGNEGFEIYIEGEKMKSAGMLARFLGITDYKGLNLELAAPPSRMSGMEKFVLGETVLIQNALFMTALALQDKLSASAPAALSTYFYTYFTNLKNILQFKSQATVLTVSRDAETGEDVLKLTANPSFVLMTNILEELLVNTPLNGIADLGMSADEVIEVSALMGFAKLLVEKLAATMEAERLRAEQRGELELAAKIEKQRLTYMRLMYNYVVPALKVFVMFAPKPMKATCDVIKKGTLAAFGCVAVAQETNRYRSMRSAVKKVAEGDCAKILVLGLIHAKAEEDGVVATAAGTN